METKREHNFYVHWLSFFPRLFSKYLGRRRCWRRSSAIICNYSQLSLCWYTFCDTYVYKIHQIYRKEFSSVATDLPEVTQSQALFRFDKCNWSINVKFSFLLHVQIVCIFWLVLRSKTKRNKRDTILFI